MYRATPRSFLAFVVCFATLILGAGAAAGQDLYRLGSPLRESSRGTAEEVLIELDPATLGAKPGLVTLPLPGGGFYRAIPEDLEVRGPGRYVWRGRLLAPGSSPGAIDVTLTVRDGLLAGSISAPDGSWRIQPLGGGRHSLAKVDRGSFPSCGGGVAPDGISDTSSGAFSEPTPGSGGIEGAAKGMTAMAVLGVYTPAARQGAGGRRQIETIVQHSIDLTNTAFLNSRVNARVVLRHAAELAITEPRDGGDALSAVTFSPTVAAWRDLWNADLVVAVLERVGPYCGMGWLMRDPGPGFAPWAFSVSARFCAASTLTVAHEIGHNLGLEHNPENSTATAAAASYPWAFGHYVDGSFHTVMSYPDPCVQGCPERPYFSHPGIAIEGDPAGIADRRDNHRALEITKRIAAQFRDFEALEARFEWDPEEPRVSAPVYFRDVSTGAPDSRSWEFGDGSTSTEAEPVHTYLEAGTYPVTLAVTRDGTRSVLSRDVEVLENVCAIGPGTLCLSGGRFQLRVSWRDFDGGIGAGTVVPADAGDSGLYWFFAPDNWEMLVKVVDGCGFNDRFWVFAAATTNVEYTLRVSDTLTGFVREYHNPLGQAAAAITATGAFATCSPATGLATGSALTTRGRRAAAAETGLRPIRAAGAPPVARTVLADPAAGEGCDDGPDRLCFHQGRFRVEVEWQDFTGNAGSGLAAPLRSDNSGLFWFFAPDNWEVLVKVVDGCGFNGHFWVFSAATTNVAYRLRVTDTATGVAREYENPLGIAAAAITDVEAFPACE